MAGCDLCTTTHPIQAIKNKTSAEVEKQKVAALWEVWNECFVVEAEMSESEKQVKLALIQSLVQRKA